jgi:S-adenosylmethionine hydrolase
MKTKQIITFLSDFGTRDGCVGIFKGDIKSSDRNIEIVDVTL